MQWMRLSMWSLANEGNVISFVSSSSTANLLESGESGESCASYGFSAITIFHAAEEIETNLRSLVGDQSIKSCFRRFDDILRQPAAVRAAKHPSSDQRKVTQASQRRQFISNQEMIHFSLSRQRLASRTHFQSFFPIKRRRNADHVESKFQRPPKIGFHFP